MENGRFNSKSFRNKSFWYELKQWNCTKISFTSSNIFAWTKETFWVNALRSLSQVSGTFTPPLSKLVSKRLHIETTLYRNDFISKRLYIETTRSPSHDRVNERCALADIRKVWDIQSTSSRKRSTACIQNSEILIVKLLQWEKPLELKRLRPLMWMKNLRIFNCPYPCKRPLKKLLDSLC